MLASGQFLHEAKTWHCIATLQVGFSIFSHLQEILYLCATSNEIILLFSKSQSHMRNKISNRIYLVMKTYCFLTTKSIVLLWHNLSFLYLLSASTDLDLSTEWLTEFCDWFCWWCKNGSFFRQILWLF